jgi:hypothetical protein
MFKSIKKIVNILTGIVAVMLLTLIVLFFICRIPSVQTFIVKKITYYISKETKSTISFGKITFTFFNRIEITDVLVKDQHNDTLLYAQNITAGIRQINPKRKIYRIGKVVVMKPVFNLISDSTGLMNLNWYLNFIQKPKDTTLHTNPYFHINQIDISDGRFSHINKYAPRTNTPIDFNNLRIAGINVIVENLDNYNDSTKLDIYNLGCRESTGLIVKKMSSNLLVHNQNIIFRNSAIICDSSIINADHVGILADSSASFRKFYEEVKLDIALRKSLISSNDLKYFVSSLKDYHETIWLSGDIKGSVAELKGRHIKATYKNGTNLDFDFDFSGLPDIEKTFMFIDVIDFSSISKDVEQVFIPGKGRIVLPETLRKLGVVSFSGTFTGFITDFVTYAKINTKKGIISTDISLRPSQSGSYNVKGLLKGSDIDLGSITDKPALFGGLSMEANVNGTASSIKKFALNLTAKIDSIEINNYKYRNIALNGYFTDKTWDGNIKVEDENINMELLGKFDFSNKLPEFDFSLKLPKANLNLLNLAKSDTSSQVSLMMTANFRGNSIDNLDGEIKLLNSNFRKNSKNLNISDFSIKSFIWNNKPAISIRTDFLDANLFGRYNFAGIENSIKRKLALLMPSRFENPKTSGRVNDNNFIFDIKFKNTDDLNRFFNSGITLSENSQIHGVFNPDSIISVAASAKQFSLNRTVFNNLSFEGNSVDTVAAVMIRSTSVDLSGLSEIKDLNFSFNSIPDKFRSNLNWDNREKTRNMGSLIAEGEFVKSAPEQKRGILRIGLQPADVYIRDVLWKVTPAVIQIDSNSVKFEKLSFMSGENYFHLDGAISANTSDTLMMEFHGISLDPLNLLYEKRQGNDPNMIRLALGGILNGKIRLTDIYKNFMFESDISVKDFRILGGHFGEIKILSEWNNKKKVADITGSNDFEGIKMIDIKGSFDPVTANADLTAKADKLPVDILNPLLKIFASGITGTASGKVNFFGNFNRPVLTGALKGENVSLKIDYLQTRYTFNDSIRFTTTGIKFNNITTYDDKQNTAIISGEVTHKYFKNFAVDMNIAIPSSNDFMILNTKPKDNELFYGTAYGSGITSIRSNSSGLSFDISARTGKDTRFFIPLSKGVSVADRSFINFVEKKTDKTIPGTNQKAALSVQTKSSFDMNFDLEVTPDAEVQIIFDAKAGDKMRGTGTGNLNINLNRNGEFKINGDYLIEDGDYLFTVGGLLNKKFIVQNGGKITFNGDIQNAEIDVKAIYKTKAKLYDIMMNMGMLSEAKLKEKIPVEVWLNLTGNLYNPVVTFDIYLPTANEETRAYLKSMIVTDEEMSRQVLFLLVMNSFYADPSLTSGGSQNSANIGTATVGVTTTEMISNQISNWLSQISRDVDIGVAYRPGSTELANSQEVELALSTQILNDRVTINGNFDYGGSQSVPGAASGNRQLSGAFDVEYRILKNSEKLRFRVFNRSNDNFYFDNTNGVQYTQGVGLFFKQDYNKLRDLFSKKPKSTVKKEKETKMKNK